MPNALLKQLSTFPRCISPRYVSLTHQYPNFDPLPPNKINPCQVCNYTSNHSMTQQPQTTELDYPMHRLIHSQSKIPLSLHHIPSPLKNKRRSATSLSKKSLIKVNKNSLPSDFFGGDKSVPVSATDTERVKGSGTLKMPFEHKRSLKEITLRIKPEANENEEINDFLRLTSCFHMSSVAQTPRRYEQNRLKQYHSHRNSQDEPCDTEVFLKSQISTDRVERRSIDRLAKIHEKLKSRHPRNNPQFQLPMINLNPLRSKIQRSQQPQEQQVSGKEFHKRIAALMNNSSFPPQTHILKKFQSQRSKGEVSKALEAGVEVCGEEMNITFFKAEKNRVSFFEE